METKIGTSSLVRSYVNSVKSISARRNASAASAPVQRAYSDTFTMSSNSKAANKNISTSADSKQGYYSTHKDKLDAFTKTARNAVQLETNIIAADDYAGKTKSNFEWISMSENGLNENLPKRLEEAGVPKDVTFEFDFDFDSKNIEIT